MDKGMVSIGDNCSISGVVFVTRSGGDRVIKNHWGVSVNGGLGRRILVGNNVTIGPSVTVMCGVTIGDDCVIGAGSFISRDVPAGTVTQPPEAAHAGRTDDYVARPVSRTKRKLISYKAGKVLEDFSEHHEPRDELRPGLVAFGQEGRRRCATKPTAASPASSSA